MVEIEWDGIEPDGATRRSLSDLLGGLARVVDPDGRARLEVAIVGDAEGCTVSVAARDAVRRSSTEVRDPDVRNAIRKAVDLARVRWEDDEARAA
jgi:hypothetical protein